MSEDHTTDPVDIHVGQLVRLRREACGFSQKVVAARLGISFQQIQKYEAGHNRISASRLYALARIFDCHVEEFFTGLPGVWGRGEAAVPAPSVPGLRGGRRAVDLTRAFARLPLGLQKRVLALVSSVAEEVGHVGR